MLTYITNVRRYALNTAYIPQTFVIPFPYWDHNEIKVFLTIEGTADDGLVELQEGEDYSLSAPNGSNGTLTRESEWDDGARLTILRVRPLKQTTDFRNGDVIDADVLEHTLDTIVAQIQQLDEARQRAMTVPVDEDGTGEGFVIPSKSERAGMLLCFDSTGNGFSLRSLESFDDDVLETRQNKNAALNAKTAAEAAQSAAESAQAEAETAKGDAEDAKDGAVEAYSQTVTAKTTALSEISSAKTTAISDIGSSKSSAITDITSAKTTAVGEISSAKTTAVGEVESSKTSALGDISSAKTTALGEVDSAKGDAVSAVTSAKTTALSEVADAQSEALQEITSATNEGIEDIHLDVQSELEGARRDIESEKDFALNRISERASQVISQIDSALEPVNRQVAQNSKDIAYLKFANEGKTYIMEESDRDGYSVDVKPSTVTGTAFGEAVLKSMEGRDVSARDGVVYPITGERVIEIAYKNSRGTQGIRSWGSTNSISFGDSEIPTTDLAKVRVGDIALVAIKNSDTGDTDYIVRGITSASATIIESGGGHGLGSIIGGAFSPNSPYGDNYGWVVMYAGTIVNNNVTEVRSEGANLWDEVVEIGGMNAGLPTSNNAFCRSTQTISVKPNTKYNLYLEDSSMSVSRVYITSYKADGTYVSEPSTGISKKVTANFTTGESIEKVRLVFYFGGTSVTSVPSIKMTMSEDSKNVVGYVPYRPPVTLSLPSICSSLHGLPTVRDRLSFVNRVYENMKTYTFTGNEAWEAFGDKCFRTPANTVDANPKFVDEVSPTPWLSDALLSTNVNLIYNGTKGVALSANGRIYIDSEAYANRASLIGKTIHYEATSGGQRYEARVLERKVGSRNLVASEWNAFQRDNDPFFYTNNAIADAKTGNNILNASGVTRLEQVSGTTRLIYPDGTDLSKVDLSGVLLYELATPQLLDVTDLVPEEPSLPIEDGGTLTFVNENKVATPSRISMPVKLGGTV